MAPCIPSVAPPMHTDCSSNGLSVLPQKTAPKLMQIWPHMVQIRPVQTFAPTSGHLGRRQALSAFLVAGKGVTPAPPSMAATGPLWAELCYMPPSKAGLWKQDKHLCIDVSTTGPQCVIS